MNIIFLASAEEEEIVLTLVDFSACIEQGTFTPSGTPWYMAPEYMQRIKITKTGVSALGVTMAWVLGYIRLPDERSGEWILPNIWDDSGELRKMEAWLEAVEGVQRKLNAGESLAQIVALTLESDPEKRIGCDVVSCLLEQGS